MTAWTSSPFTILLLHYNLATTNESPQQLRFSRPLSVGGSETGFLPRYLVTHLDISQKPGFLFFP